MLYLNDLTKKEGTVNSLTSQWTILLPPELGLPVEKSCVAALESLYLIGYIHFMGSEGRVLYDWLIQIKIVT